MIYHKRYVFIAACLGMLLFGITIISLGSILPDIITRYHIDDIAAGTLAALLPFGILAGSVVFGPLTDRFGHKYLLIICSLLIMIALEGIAISQDYLLLRISVFIIGFSGGFVNGSTNALVNDISEEGRSANLSLLGVFFGIGALGMPLLIGIFSELFSTKTIISLVGLFMIIPVIYFFFVRFPKPKLTRDYPLKESFRMMRDPVLLLTGFFLFFEGGLEGITNNWTTTYLQNWLTADKQQALFALSSFVLSMTLTRLLLGFVLRKIPSYLIQLISIFMAFTGILILILVSTYYLTILGLVFIGMGFACGFPVILAYVGELFKKLSGTAFGIVMVISLIGNMIINYSMGLVIYRFGIKHFSSLLLICILLLLLMFYFVIRNIRNKIDIHSV
jgi:FHS family glucose/mannose:H+ symporter-like MFS transporter